jgi:hypothetical protein
MRHATLLASACRVRAVGSTAGATTSAFVARLPWLSAPGPGGWQGPRGLLAAALRFDAANISCTAADSIDDDDVRGGEDGVCSGPAAFAHPPRADTDPPTRGRSRTERPAAVECWSSIFFRDHERSSSIHARSRQAYFSTGRSQWWPRRPEHAYRRMHAAMERSATTAVRVPCAAATAELADSNVFLCRTRKEERTNYFFGEKNLGVFTIPNSKTARQCQN